MSVCMINYNGAAYLERSLAAVLGQDLALAEVVVVDNGSDDDSLTLVRERFPRVRLVEMPANVGPAAARNVALEEAKGDVVVLIDNDVAPMPGALGALVEALVGAPAAVMAVPAVVDGSDGKTVQYDGAETHFLGHQRLQHEREAYGAMPLGVRETGSMVSACVAVERTRLPARDAAGRPFDEDFFIYFEDHDLGYRMRAAGLKVLSVPASECRHGLGTEGLSIRSLGGYSPARVYYHIRNRWIFIIKNYSVRTILVLAPMLAAYEAVQLAGVVKKGWLRQWLRAAAWIATHPRSLYGKRRCAQRGRRAADRALLSNGPVPLRREATASGMERSVKRVLDRASGAYWRLAMRLL